MKKRLIEDLYLTRRMDKLQVKINKNQKWT